ncbi:hypothetical protein M3Y97_00046200 [Aphelenchoides bicaudatus]|nr:hypothetical protein M3Y97_00046200 [Aphelenchoides bicaudatus]
MYTASKQSQSSAGSSPVQSVNNVDEQLKMETETDQIKLLERLNRLQLDCSVLNNFIERVLTTSGICRRYTHPNEPAYCNLKQLCGATGKRSAKKGTIIRSQQRTTRPQPQILIHPSALKGKPKIYRHSCVRPEKSFDQFTVAAFQRLQSGTAKTKTTSKWVPRVTVPQPFKMTLRDQHTRARSTYSKRFLEKMLREKREKQLAELLEHQKIFKANPIPKTTYAPDLPAKIGQLKQRSKSVTALRDTTKVEKPKKFHSNPVPLSTFFRPLSSDEGRRKQQRFQRALNLLATASEPGHMAEHSIRWKVQQKLRHVPKCFQRQDQTDRVRSKSVPDFRRMHRDFEAKLDDLKLFRPPTLIEPFHFHLDYPKHYCKEWTFAIEEKLQKEKKTHET